MIKASNKTFYANIFIGTNPGYDGVGGEFYDNIYYPKVKRICETFVEKGLCVTIKKIEFIYTGGGEKGFEIGLIQYPRFKRTEYEILNDAADLAVILMKDLKQFRCSIVTPNQTYLLENEAMLMDEEYTDK